MLAPTYRNNFKKDLKKAKARSKNLTKITAIMELLIDEKPLAAKHKNHKLKGDYIDHWECHVEPDWLLVYKKTKTEIFFERTGTHSDLFE